MTALRPMLAAVRRSGDLGHRHPGRCAGRGGRSGRRKRSSEGDPGRAGRSTRRAARARSCCSSRTGCRVTPGQQRHRAARGRAPPGGRHPARGGGRGRLCAGVGRQPDDAPRGHARARSGRRPGRGGERDRRRARRWCGPARERRAQASSRPPWSSRPTGASRASSSRTRSRGSISVSGRSKSRHAAFDGAGARPRRPRSWPRRASGSPRRRSRGSPPSSRAWACCERTLGERSVLMMERLRAQRRRAARAQCRSEGDFSGSAGPWATPTRSWTESIPVRPLVLLQPTVPHRVSVALFAIYVARPGGQVAGVLRPPGRPLHAQRRFREPWSSSGSRDRHHRHPRAGPRLHLQVLRRPGPRDRGDALYFEPAFFCNVNDAWTFPELKARLWVTAAGSWIQLVVASIAAIVWWAATPGTLVSEIALSAVLIGGYHHRAHERQSADPAGRLLRAQATSWRCPTCANAPSATSNWSSRPGCSVDLPAPAADEREKRIFLLYGGIGSIYIAVILLFFAFTVYGWLTRWLGALGVLAFLGGLIMMLQAPVQNGFGMSEPRSESAGLPGAKDLWDAGSASTPPESCFSAS